MLLVDWTCVLVFVARLIASPATACILMAAARASLLAFGVRWWLLGHALTFLLFAGTLAHAALVQAFARAPRTTPGDAVLPLSTQDFADALIAAGRLVWPQ